MEGFSFADLDSGDDGWCCVRIASAGVVGLTTSLRTDGDIEVFFSPADARRLAELLSNAAGACEGS